MEKQDRYSDYLAMRARGSVGVQPDARVLEKKQAAREKLLKQRARDLQLQRTRNRSF